MHDPLRMGGFERVGNLSGEIDHLGNLEGRFQDPMLERLAVEELHDDEVPAVVGVNVIDCADARVVQRRRGLRFAL